MCSIVKMSARQVATVGRSLVAAAQLNMLLQLNSVSICGEVAKNWCDCEFQNCCDRWTVCCVLRVHECG